jgi:hypothetical protein
MSITPGPQPTLSGNGTFEINTITGANLASMAPDAVRKQWANGFRFGERNEDPYMQMEGTGLDDLVQVDKSAANGRGTVVTFKEMMRYVKAGKMGDSLFLDAESFETPTILPWQVRVDLIRHALSSSDYVEEINGMRNEIQSNEHELQGEWMGRKKSELTEITMALKASGVNTQFAGNKTWSTLSFGDTLSYDDVIDAKEIMKSYVRPAQIRRRGRNTVKNYLFVCPTPGLGDLEKELINSNMITQADIRGAENFVFAGGWLDLRGQTIMERDAVDEAMAGPLGVPLAPHAKLGAAIAAGTATFNIVGNGNANWATIPETQPFRFFPGHAYKFNSFETFDPTAVALDVDTWAKRPLYVKVINLTGADKGKWGMYEFANNHAGEQLAVTSRLGSAASGIRVTTLGSVTWDATKNTDAHPIGSAVLPCTAAGTTYVGNLVMGARSLMRAYGLGIQREQERFNGLVYRKYISQYFGQAPTYDVAGRMQGFRVLISAARYPQFKSL